MYDRADQHYRGGGAQRNAHVDRRPVAGAREHMNHENAARIDEARLAAHEHEIARAETRPPGRNSRPESEIRPNDADSRIARPRIAARRPEPEYGDVEIGRAHV